MAIIMEILQPFGSDTTTISGIPASNVNGKKVVSIKTTSGDIIYISVNASTTEIEISESQPQ